MHVVLLGCGFPAGPEIGIDRVHVRRARALAARAAVVAVVPTPWAPRALAGAGGRWARYHATPRRAEIDGIRLLYPRYVQVPGMGPWAGIAMAIGVAPLVRRLRGDGRCDVLFAQSVLPEGLAAVLLGRWLGVPVACLGRGTDVHALARASSATRGLARWTLRRTTAIGVVADALRQTLARVVGTAACTVLTNGIDLEQFAPGDAEDARRALGLEAAPRLILYVGRLAEGKGLPTLLQAFRSLRAAEPGLRLAIVGAGPLEAWVERRVRTTELGRAVHLAGEVPHQAIAAWMRAADVVVVPSAAEGFPNVAREALACGRPVVATTVGDLPHVLTPAAGRLVPPGDPAALARALREVLARPWDAGAIRAHVSGMSWERSGEATARFLAAATTRSA